MPRHRCDYDEAVRHRDFDNAQETTQSMTEYTDILYTEADGVATITINRPKVYNAFNAETGTLTTAQILALCREQGAFKG